jgi:O-antigen/teichoic acid export membrane protein
MLLSFIYFRPLPKLLWERIKAIQILQRGKWITMAGIFNYLYQFGDNLVVGRMLGLRVGLYDYAYKIPGPVSEISDVVAGFLPVLSNESGSARLKAYRYHFNRLLRFCADWLDFCLPASGISYSGYEWVRLFRIESSFIWV